MFYSASEGGFYSREIHGDNMPADVVEITAKEHAALMDGQSAGQVIAADASGRPVLQDPPPLTEEEMKQHEIQQDKQYLADTDWIVAKISEASLLGQDTAPLLAQYDEQLEARDQARTRIRVNEGWA